jgi:hypothetical protein
MSPEDRLVIDRMLKKNIIGICPKDKRVCKLIKLMFKTLGVVWTECRLLDDEVKFLTEDDIGIHYYNNRRK